MARGVVVFSGAVLLAVVGFGSGLKCYSCDTNSDAGCKTVKTGDADRQVDCGNNKNLPTVLQNLPAGTPACAKFVTTSGDVYRSCAINVEWVVCQAFKMAHPAKECFICTDDLCNYSNSVTVSLPIGFIALIASYLI